jgi:hypothetical protein
MRRQVGIAAFIVGTTLAATTPAGADVVTAWNECAPTIIGMGRATVVFGAGPAVQLDMATVHLAMHDAIQVYAGRFELYAAASGTIAPGEGSAIAAAARAAHTMLSTKFPTQLAAIDACYLTSMVGVELTQQQLDDSNAAGAAAANNVLDRRNGDGSYPANPAPFRGGTGPGQWSTPAASMVAPWLGDVVPFAIESVERCQPDDPPALTSAEYAEGYNQVKALGAKSGSTRTSEQGRIARMFSGNFPAQFNRLMRDLSAAYVNGTDLVSLGDRGRLFALANMAAADAAICSWHSKRAFNLWRPIQAVRNGGDGTAGDSDGNLLTVGDPAWESYMPTPNYPDYTSGANNFGGSMTRILQLFFGSDQPFDTLFRIYPMSPAVPPLSDLNDPDYPDPPFREYLQFSAIARDIIDARIYLGIHFMPADREGWSQGRRVANHAFRNFLTPVK